MRDLLYLDTARIGQICPAAQLAHRDFTRLAGEVGGSILLERFLCHGFQVLPSGLQRALLGLSTWDGVGHLLNSLRQLCNQPSELPLLVANRSAQLMKLASHAIWARCRNVLICDLGWPGYHDILEQERVRLRHRQTILIPLEAMLLREGADDDSLVDFLCRAAIANNCDGLFLPAVSSRGIVLPIERILSALDAAIDLRFAVVDGAQEFCHLGTDLCHGMCDLYITGCHKWLRALLPMGVAFYGKRRSVDFIEATLDQMLEVGDLDDPLLRFARQLAVGKLDPIRETVSISSLFTAQAAASQLMALGQSPVERLRIREQNRSAVMDLVTHVGWQPLVTQSAVPSGIVLLEAERSMTRTVSADWIRETLFDTGIAATTYDGGMVRLSMPDNLLNRQDLAQLEASLASAA